MSDDTMTIHEQQHKIREGLVRIEVSHLSGMSVEGVSELEWHETTAMVKAAHWMRAELWTGINLAFLADNKVVIKDDVQADSQFCPNCATYMGTATAPLVEPATEPGANR